MSGQAEVTDEAVHLWLRDMSRPLVATMSYVHWINARNANTDQGLSYCKCCAQKIVEQSNAANPDHEYFVDGGWSTESDVPEHCDDCGETLDCHLTTCGLEYELDHFEAHRIALRGKHAAYVAYSMTQILEAAQIVEENALLQRCTRLKRRLRGAYRRALAKH